MKLSAELILYKLRDFGLLHSQGMEDLHFDGVRLRAVDRRYLCICSADALTPEMADSDCAFLTVGEPAALPKACAVVDAAYSVTQLHDAVQSLFDCFSDYETQLAEAALETGYDAMVQCAWEMSHRPVILMDGSLRILTLAPDEDFPQDEEWTHMRKYGFASLEGLRNLRESGEFDTLLHLQGPALYGPGIFANPAVVSSIISGGTCIARVCMTGLLGELTPFDMQVMNILSEQLTRKLRLDEGMLRGVGNDPVYSVLFDLIRGLKLDNHLITSRLGGLLGWNGGRYAVLFVPAAATDEMSYKYYSGLLKHRLDCSCVHYEGGLAAVLHMQDVADLPETEKLLGEYLLENGLAGGMSYCFEDITQLREHYEQAAMALRYGGEEAGLYLFSACAMRHMMSLFPQEQLRLLIHPALPVLREHDLAMGTELYGTLHSYLEHERSLVKTAAALFIHRNTLLYRLEKLHQLVELDLDDPELRLHLTLSYRLLERL